VAYLACVRSHLSPCNVICVTFENLELVTLIRPPDIGLVVGELRFYRDSIFYPLSFFVSYPPNSLNETQPKPEVSAI